MNKPVLWFDEYIHLDAQATCRYFLPPDRWLNPRNGKGLLVSFLVVGVGPAIAGGHEPTLSFGQSAMPTDATGSASADSPFTTLYSQLVLAGSKYYSVLFGFTGVSSPVLPVAPAPLGYFAFSLACDPATAVNEWSAVRLRVFVAEAE